MGWFSRKPKEEIEKPMEKSVAPSQQANAPMTREQKMEIYARLVAVGQRRIDLGAELYQAIKSHDFEMATVIVKLGSELPLINDGMPTEVISYFRQIGCEPSGIFLRDGSPECVVDLIRARDYQALDFIVCAGLSIKFEVFNIYNDRHQFNALDICLNDQKMMTYLLAHGVKPAVRHADNILLNHLPPGHFRLLLEYGLDIKAATDVFSKHAALNKLPAAYISEIAEMLKLPPAVKSVLPKPPEPKMPVEIAAQKAVVDPDIIVIERPFLGNRTICYEFNFKTRERTAAVRKDEFSPIESLETKKFSDLRDHPDLLDAFTRHQQLGGTRSEEEVGLKPKAVAKTIRVNDMQQSLMQG